MKCFMIYRGALYEGISFGIAHGMRDVYRATYMCDGRPFIWPHEAKVSPYAQKILALPPYDDDEIAVLLCAIVAPHTTNGATLYASGGTPSRINPTDALVVLKEGESAHFQQIGGRYVVKNASGDAWIGKEE